MYVCICNSVTDKDIRRAAARGTRTMRQLREETGCASTCGQCARMAKALLDEAQPAPTRLPISVLSPAFA